MSRLFRGDLRPLLTGCYSTSSIPTLSKSESKPLCTYPKNGCEVVIRRRFISRHQCLCVCVSVCLFICFLLKYKTCCGTQTIWFHFRLLHSLQIGALNCGHQSICFFFTRKLQIINWEWTVEVTGGFYNSNPELGDRRWANLLLLTPRAFGV